MPRVFVLGMGGGEGGSAAARLTGSATAGVLEIGIFHPIDTIAKRLMSNNNPVFGDGFGTGMSRLNTVCFRDAADAGFFSKWGSLFPGVGFATGYKVSQRIYKWGGQLYVKDYLNKHYSKEFNGTFGNKHGKTMMHAVAGSIIGIGEVMLLPLDILKIKAQTNPESIAGRNIFQIFYNEGFLNMYRGTMWTIARNAPGSFALFGGSALTKEMCGLKNYNDATFKQNFLASTVGAVCSIVITNPLDVIKTRIQNRSFDNPESGMQVVRNLVKNEGFTAFFKGVIPKTAIVGPKLIFSFTIAQSLISYIDNMSVKK